MRAPSFAPHIITAQQRSAPGLQKSSAIAFGASEGQMRPMMPPLPVSHQRVHDPLRHVRESASRALYGAAWVLLACDVRSFALPSCLPGGRDLLFQESATS